MTSATWDFRDMIDRWEQAAQQPWACEVRCLGAGERGSPLV
ncbi:hypothetical protein [Saccharopolyspora spinosa]|nr:hypothetical protein [Saccharopolyspora spinosa]